MSRLTPRSLLLLILPALIGATIGATIYRVVFPEWDMLGWLTAALGAAIVFAGSAMSSRD